jgi:hypothetical protein
MVGTDSAGVPWEGRAFQHNPGSDDDGSAPERLVEALRRFRSRELGEAEVVAALRDSRLLIPLVAVLGDSGHNDHGHLVDKSQELSIVTVAGPDGRTVMPVFTSVAAMAVWNPRARPVPADAVRVAVAAASEGTELVVLDPTSTTEFVLRRPALWAIAQGQTWLPCYLDEEVLDAFLRSAEPEPSVVAVQLSPNDPDARLAGAELLVHLSLVDGLDRNDLTKLLERLGKRWADNEIIAARVDSMRVQLAATT